MHALWIMLFKCCLMTNVKLEKGKHSRQEMADQLFVSIKTIDFHLKNLRDKTESNTTAELVRFAIRNGYQE